VRGQKATWQCGTYSRIWWPDGRTGVCAQTCTLLGAGVPTFCLDCYSAAANSSCVAV
jgi:hypothetical protein